MEQTTVRRQIVVAKNYDELCSQSVQKILNLSQKAVRERGRCVIALSGGSTPRGLFTLMAGTMYGDQFDWRHIHFFLVDERWVPLTNSRSNYKMISETLGMNTKIPASHFHPVATDTSNVHSSADQYEKELIDYFSIESRDIPHFDIILLGLGDDGHTASLFPDNPAVEIKSRLVVPVAAKGIPEPRVTLTLPIINNARAVIFLVSGSGKAEMLKKIVEEHEPLPAGRINPHHGTLMWYVDESAAALLHSPSINYNVTNVK